MTWEANRQRTGYTIQNKYIFGRFVRITPFQARRDNNIQHTPQPANLSFIKQPLLHTIVALIEMALVARLVSRFNSSYEERPRTFWTLFVAARAADC